MIWPWLLALACALSPTVKKTFYPDGKLATEVQFGAKFILWQKTYAPSGKLQQHDVFHNGFEFTRSEFYPSGVRKFTGKFLPGVTSLVPQGLHQHFAENGKLALEQTFDAHGVLEGSAKIYYPHGQVRLQTQFSRGLKLREIEYDPEGSVRRHDDYPPPGVRP